MKEQPELTAMSETITPRAEGSRNPRPIHGFADYGPILGVITLDFVQGYIESLYCDPLTNEEIRDFVGFSRMYDRDPTFAEIIEEVRLNPPHYPPSSDATDQFRYLWYDNPSDLGGILDVVTLDEVKSFLNSNGHAPLTEAERFCFAFYFVGASTLHWVDDIVNKIRPEIGRIIDAVEPNQSYQNNVESSPSANELGLPRIVIGVDGEVHLEEIDRSGTRCG